MEPPSGQTTEQHRRSDGTKRQAVGPDSQPGHKHTDSQSYPRTCQEPAGAYRHDSFVKPAGMGGSGFFEDAKAHKDQQNRSLISPREQRTRRLSKARHKGE